MRKDILFTPVAPLAVLALIGAVIVCWIPGEGSAQAQSKAKSSRSNRPVNVKAIDVRAEQAQQTFIREAADLAKSYEDAGRLEKAKQMLETILSVKADVPGVQAKIKQLDEAILTSNEFEFDYDTSKGWGKPVAQVFKGRSFRIQPTGNYRFAVDMTVDPAGFSTNDVNADMAADVPCGALMGVFFSEGKPGKPFLVGTGGEHTPKEDGYLLLRVNAPSGNKCTGQLKVRISGYARAM